MHTFFVRRNYLMKGTPACAVCSVHVWRLRSKEPPLVWESAGGINLSGPPKRHLVCQRRHATRPSGRRDALGNTWATTPRRPGRGPAVWYRFVRRSGSGSGPDEARWTYRGDRPAPPRRPSRCCARSRVKRLLIMHAICPNLFVFVLALTLRHIATQHALPMGKDIILRAVIALNN